MFLLYFFFTYPTGQIAWLKCKWQKMYLRRIEIRERFFWFEYIQCKWIHSCSSTLASSMSSCCFDSASSLHQDCGDRCLSLHTHLCGEDPERSGVYVGAVPRTAHRAATPHTLQQHRRCLRLLRHTVCDVAAAFHGWVCAVVLMFSLVLFCCSVFSIWMQLQYYCCYLMCIKRK